MVYTNKKHEMADTINRIDMNINTWVLQAGRLAENTVNNQTVLTLLGGEPLSGGQMDLIGEWFYNFADTLAAVSNIYIIDSEGEVAYHLNPLSTGVNQGMIANYQAEAEKNRKQEKWMGVVPSLNTDQEGTVVTMVRAIDITNPGSTGYSFGCGLLVVELDPQIFSETLLSNHSLFPRQYTLITDKNGFIISTNKNVKHLWLDVIEGQFRLGERQFELHWEGRDYFVCGQYNGVTGWKTFSLVAVDDIFPQSAELQKSVFTMVVVAVLLGILVISMISYTFTQPIARLTAAMGEVERGDFEISIINKNKDEIGNLTSSFNLMVEKINYLVKAIYQEKLAQKSAELEALQAQINPHFLYNALDSINWMLIDIDAIEISQVIVSLGDILKYSIHGSDTLVSLGEEIRYIESYLCIQKYRLEDRLSIKLEIPEAMLACLVPRLILQPIVENAVLHGVEATKGQGQISISGKITKEELLIFVKDNGPGMEEGELQQCRAMIYSRDTSKDSIGMRNVHRRICLRFGDSYGLEINSVPGNGTEIILHIPASRR